MLAIRNEARAAVQNLVDTVIDRHVEDVALSLAEQHAAFASRLDAKATLERKRDEMVERRLVHAEDALAKVVADWGAAIQVASKSIETSTPRKSTAANVHVRMVFPGTAPS